MKKRVYAKPVMESETFVPQNYIAACGEENRVYKFVCDAGSAFEGQNRLYIEQNGIEGWQPNKDKLLTSSYHKCGKEHYVKANETFEKAKLTYYMDGGYNNKILDVIYYVEDGYNYHCTTNIQQESWETVKS